MYEIQQRQFWQCNSIGYNWGRSDAMTSYCSRYSKIVFPRGCHSPLSTNMLNIFSLFKAWHRRAWYVLYLLYILCSLFQSQNKINQKIRYFWISQFLPKMLYTEVQFETTSAWITIQGILIIDWLTYTSLSAIYTHHETNKNSRKRIICIYIRVVDIIICLCIHRCIPTYRIVWSNIDSVN